MGVHDHDSIIPAQEVCDWIEHDGKGCPLPYNALVYVKLNCGSEDQRATLAGGWSAHGRDRWKRQHDWYIVAYRIAVNLPQRLDRIAARRAA